jgi:predicted RNA binding protein YcfA (HicA-like mRNA interferase family)
VSPRLPAVTAREAARVAVGLGFRFSRQQGSHAVYRRDSDGRRVVIPMHPGRTLKPKTLLGVVADMGITLDEFRSLL